MMRIRGLRVWFPLRRGLMRELVGGSAMWVRALDGVSFDVKRGEVFCLVGESGCGKTTTGKALLRLVDATDGDVFFEMPDADYAKFKDLRGAVRTPEKAEQLNGLRRKYSLSWKEEVPWTLLQALLLAAFVGAGALAAIFVPALLAGVLARPFTSDGVVVGLSVLSGFLFGLIAALPPTRLSKRTPSIVALIALFAFNFIPLATAWLLPRAVPEQVSDPFGTLSIVWGEAVLGMLVSVVFVAAVAGGVARTVLSIRSDREGLRGIQMRTLRRRLHLIFQDPYESLNPKQSVFEIVSEPLTVNRISHDPQEIAALVSHSLEDAGLRPAEEFMFRFPHELSGGQRQRVSIAAALALEPDFIVADEPVSMLDVSIRTEILELMMELRRRRNMTYLFITHDLGLAWILADRIAVMYLGKIVEQGTAEQVIAHPHHPYTQALISVVPSPDPRHIAHRTILQGERPDPVFIPLGCRFHPRCPMAFGPCGWSRTEVVQALRDARDEILREAPEKAPALGVDRSVAETLRGTVIVRWPKSLELRPRTGVTPTALADAVRAIVAGRRDRWRGLYGIASAVVDGQAVRVILQNPVEPQLVQIAPWNSVACHLVSAPEGAAAPVPAAAPVA